MKMSGILAEKGLHVFDHEPKTHSGHCVPRVWIIVADKGRFRVWRKGGAGFEEIAHANFKIHDHHGSHEDHQETMAVETLSEWLSEVRDEDVFDRLVLVASKRMLGVFREKLPTDIIACIAAEIPKDLTHMDKMALEEALRKIIVI